ncbi:restriction endonuclease [Phytomonospora endophytica]|uniref:Restriction endonuclease type IV Mrr domain-containing protein n=1 Tax=Phytomonospora endophytica TaxID=714109 RepID=A0A841FAW0_9ACTN|nr:restriction endonuclease [Phytomonospora endophytica]MBB6032904.1 hypothetical protein [Phytomonospora endophytica]GIG65130.1 hypothetical protein Pen01_14250 [Phytomonospora endophytica]
MHDIASQRRLLEEYGRLERLVGHTTQTRGQRFDHFIAETFKAWGLTARASQRGRGEIDVVFTSGVNQRHLLEAKWLAGKVDTGPLAKLHKRVQQRLNGVSGVFLSMSGYTPDALADLKDGQRLETLLLDRSHFEAILSGITSAEELFHAVHDRAAFHGDPYTPVDVLLAGGADEPAIDFGDALTDTLATPLAGAKADTVLTVRATRSLCVAAGSGSSLLLATDGGVFEADPATTALTRRIALAGPFRDLLGGADGTAHVARGAGVARVGVSGGPVAVGGGLGDVVRLRRTGAGLQALTDGDGGYRLLDMGPSLAEQVEHAVTVAGPGFTDLCWDGEDVLGVRGRHLWHSAEGDVSTELSLERVRSLGDGRVVVVGRDDDDVLVLAVGDFADRRFTQVLRFGREIVFRGFIDGDRLLLTVRDDSAARSAHTVIQVHVPEVLDAPVPASRPSITVATAPAPPEPHTLAPRPWASPSSDTPVVSTGAPAAPSWDVERGDRANAGPSAAFSENHGFAVAMTVVAVFAVPGLGLAAFLADIAVWARVVLAVLAVLVCTAAFGALQSARSPIRLEMGEQGIQFFGRKKTAWFPWECVQDVAVHNVGAIPHITVACSGAAAFPRTDVGNTGPRYIPKLDRVAVVSLNNLKADRAEVVAALRAFAPTKFTP